jgi:putative glycosyltransferase (TIGR04348 family)
LITIATPPGAHELSGNCVTAERWAQRLEELDHQVTIREAWTGQACDLLIALHAVKSFVSLERFREQRPDSPLVVALAGTDLYLNAGRPEVKRALDLATRIVVLQPAALERLDPDLRRKSAVIYQSAVAPATREAPDSRVFEVCVLAHLRDPKDPLLAARAARLLPATSRVVVSHAGAALGDAWAEAAREEQRDNDRYHWLGPLSRDASAQLLARSRLLVLTSSAEGGANVISEAVASGIPILSTRIEGSVGLLGSDYPGYFEPGDARGLAALLHRAESDDSYRDALLAPVTALQPLFTPDRERETWKALLATLPR